MNNYIKKHLVNSRHVPSPEEVASLEDEVGFVFTDTQKFFIGFNRASFKSQIYFSLSTKQIFSGEESQVHLSEVYPYFMEGWSDLRCFLEDYDNEYFPVFYTFGGDLIVINSDEKVFYMDHEVVARGSDVGIYFLCESFNVFLKSLKEDEDPYEIFNYATSLSDLKGFDEDVICRRLAMRGNLKVFEEAYNKGYRFPELIRIAAMNGNFSIVEFLISKGLSPYELQSDGRTILQWLDWKPKYCEIFKKIIES